MARSNRPPYRPGNGLRLVGALIVLAGLVTVLLAAAGVLFGSGLDRSREAGIGMALIMSGLMVLLIGNYVHHGSR